MLYENPILACNLIKCIGYQSAYIMHACGIQKDRDKEHWLANLSEALDKKATFAV